MADHEKLENEYKKVQADLKQTGDQLKQYAEQTAKDVKAGIEMNAELKNQVDTALSEFGKLSSRFQDVEQKLARGADDGPKIQQSIGHLVANSEQLKGINSSFRGSRRVEVPRAAITSVDGSGAALVAPDRRAGLILPPNRRMTIRDLLAPGTTTSNSIEYVRETGFTNNSRPVAETTAKPYSDITFELENAPVRTIAHLFKASRQILDDAAQLQSYIDARARYGLLLTEEQQFLYGNGTGVNLHGIIPQASAFSPAFTPAAEQGIDRIRLALLQAMLAEFPANGIVLNPIDWARIELTKNAEDSYIVGRPQDGTAPRLWNLPVVETQAITADDFLVGSFNLGAQIFDRDGVEVLISTENADDFEKNMVTIRAEQRTALAVYRPEAFVTGALLAS